MFYQVIKSSLIVAFFCMLTACNHSSQNQFLNYIRNPESLRPELARCQAMTQVQIEHDSDCLIALDAYQQLMTLGKQLQESPEQFGQEIMQAQTQLLVLQNQFKLAKPEDRVALQQEITAQQRQINIMLAVTVAMGE